ncbi:NUDIX hydrolase [Micromonospora parathelypteridis]|uniref:8-oxo-dGTP pyrophosphatase MutT (NUDIX family) n=1 Tax=Micromonospora parathelypteridis TaxID=1839617 RepID=A0A840W4Q4_9ACTN|nr:8-oxo-dGTP pyrophosphatase MutT (NUDIX family) [Micromonospora parathelypteridis]GGO02537.1 NUDIX hydrolase [Micromonospora parathelypteridis]
MPDTAITGPTAHPTDPETYAPLHADATALLEDWQPTSPEAASARERTLTLLGAGPIALSRQHRPGHITASTLVLDATGTRVLLCLHAKFARWVQLGGHCEPVDQTLVDAALREATEESGIAGLRIDPVPIDIDVHEVLCQGGSRHYDVRFAVLAPPGAVEQVSDEAEELGWFPPDQLPEPLAGGTAQLVAPALAALRRSPLRLAP